MTDEVFGAYFVVTSDGTPFRCHIEHTRGELGPVTDVWIFTRIGGQRYTGPRATLPATTAEILAIVDGWWQDRKAGPYANVTAETLRAKLLAEGN